MGGDAELAILIRKTGLVTSYKFNIEWQIGDIRIGQSRLTNCCTPLGAHIVSGASASLHTG